MDLLLTEQQALFAETATRLCLDHGGTKRLRTLRAAAAEIDPDAWREIIKSEWVTTVVAEGQADRGSAHSISRLRLNRPAGSSSWCRSSRRLRRH